MTTKDRYSINLGGVKILKKLFSSFSNEKFEDEFSDVEIVNGKLIKKDNLKKMIHL